MKRAEEKIETSQYEYIELDEANQKLGQALENSMEENERLQTKNNELEDESLKIKARVSQLEWENETLQDTHDFQSK